MKIQRVGILIAIVTGILSVAVVLHDTIFARGVILQDRRSGRVILRENQLLLPRRERLLYSGSDFEEKYAIWQQGAAVAHDPPLEVGAVAAVEDSRGHRYLIRLAELDSERRTAVFEIVDFEARIRHRAELDENRTIPLAHDVNIPWSVHTPSEVYLYADRYLEKPVNQLYRIAFLGTSDLKDDFATLPAHLFQSIPVAKESTQKPRR